MKYLLITWIMLAPPDGMMVGLTSVPTDDPTCAKQIAVVKAEKVDGYVCVPASAVVGSIRKAVRK